MSEAQNNTILKTLQAENAILDAETQRQQYLRALKARLLFDASIEHPEPENLLRIGDNGILPLADISMIAGKAKAGKSYVSSILIASVLGCTDFGFYATRSDAKVLYYDTEQQDANIGRIQRRVHRLCGWKVNENNPRFQVYPMRGEEVKDRFVYIRDLIELERPQLVIIDGIADLIFDYNDVRESMNIITQILALCSLYHVAILPVLHENKSKEDNNMKGHLGTMSLQKCVSLFTVTKSNGRFTVTNTESRNRVIDDWSFVIGEDGLPKTVESLQMERAADKEAKKIEDLKFMLSNVFLSSDDRYLYSELRAKIVQVIGCSPQTAERRIKQASEGKILRCEGGIYTLPEPTPEPPPQQSEVSNN